MIGEANSNGGAQALPVQVQRKGMGLRGADDEKNRTLTRTEGKLLDLLLDPATRHLKQKEIYTRAGCSKSRYWTIMQDPWFQEQRRNLLRTMVQEQAAAFVKAAADTAATPGRDGFQDRRLLLTLSGDHVERRQHDHQVTGRVVVGVVGVSMDELG